ncbi:hypothetical protein D5086_016839 [Populus alba]|uniref:Uncharacterized protein n=1 Tax=Populus alba TaxID=43335 RepID=A0ACC4BVA4_POPAL
MAEDQSKQKPKPESVTVDAETKRDRLPYFLLSVRLKYVKLGYHYLISSAMYLLLVPLLFIASAHLSTLTIRDFVQLWNHLKFNFVSVTLCSGVAGCFSEENLAFQKKILERSGLGQNTYFPEAVMRVTPRPCMEDARKEAEMVMFGAIDELLAKTGVKAKDIGILIVNCSLFNPTPSLSAMIINHYKLRGNILSYNLGGMGCSAGLISIDLAKQLLQV